MLVKCPICNKKVSSERISSHIENAAECLPSSSSGNGNGSGSGGPSFKVPKTTSSSSSLATTSFTKNPPAPNGNAATTAISATVPAAATGKILPPSPQHALPVLPASLAIASSPPLEESTSQELGSSSSSSISSRVIPAKENTAFNAAFSGGDSSLKRKRAREEALSANAPLAEKCRPTALSDFRGQASISPTSDLATLIGSEQATILPNLILWGPPGCGKTTCARIIGRKAGLYLEFSATTHKVEDIRAGTAKALKYLTETGQRACMFVDEIHRFTKAQQDVFLQSVERGEYTLLCATTENPSFRLNNALLSRCKVVVFEKLEKESIIEILERALTTFVSENVQISPEILDYIANLADGDARVSLNILELIVQTSIVSKKAPTLEGVRKAYLKSSMLYDKDGDQHYDIISALHKSLRGSDPNASLYWLGRMIYAGEDPLYVCRRLVRFASEDIGLANNEALPLALACYQSCALLGMPECDVILSHCVCYLAQSPKNIAVYKAIKNVRAALASEPAYPVPLHLRNAPTSLMKDLNYGKEYKYNPDYEGSVDQDYLPPQLLNRNFFN